MNQRPVCQRFVTLSDSVFYLVRDNAGSLLWLTPFQTVELFQYLQSNLDQLTRDAAYTPDVTVHEWQPPVIDPS